MLTRLIVKQYLMPIKSGLALFNAPSWANPFLHLSLYFYGTIPCCGSANAWRFLKLSWNPTPFIAPQSRLRKVPPLDLRSLSPAQIFYSSTYLGFESPVLLSLTRRSQDRSSLMALLETLDFEVKGYLSLLLNLLSEIWQIKTSNLFS